MKWMPVAATAALLTMLTVPQVLADKLDDIIASGVLRCAIVLDFPPMGSRDASNNPIGFDVDTCNDLAAALGVTPEYVETPFPDRIPALVSGRADVGVASTSDTLERAKTIGFSIPYFAFTNVVLTRTDAGIASYDDLKDKKLGSVAGTFEAILLEDDMKTWGSSSTFQGYQAQADVFQALGQGQIDATVVTSTVAFATIASGNFDNLMVAGDAPYPVDYVSLIGLRGEYGLLNYLNLFVHHQIRSGRYQELYNKHVGEGAAPNLVISGAYY
jgi:polar amino acid transport system substrate-binding protein